MTDSTEKHTCRCNNCGNGCSDKKKKHEAPAEQEPIGFLATRPWIWIALGYLCFLGVMFAFVWIAETHLQPSVLR